MRTMLWQGLDAPFMELARVEVTGTEPRADGTQLGVAYELRYELSGEMSILAATCGHLATKR